MTAILGVSAFYHDSAAALLVDGKIVAAAQEERFTRKKYDERFPVKAVEYCLREGGLDAGQLDYVAFYDKPFLKFQRLLETYLAYAPEGFSSFCKAIPVWINQKLNLTREMNRGLNHAYRNRYVFTQHHESHAASAFFPSPFEDAAVLTLDGVGEWASASIASGRNNQLTLIQEQHFPHSLGLLYSAFTYYCGFSVNSGEYKLMGLAPYGTPRYTQLILENMLDLKEDGSFRLDMSYFNYCQGLTMTSDKFHRLFGGPPRKPDTLLTERDMDIAASIQKVTEEIILLSARHAHKLTGSKNLCMAGGVALNCVANGKLLREGPFENLWVQPAAGDAGGALGAALFLWHQLLGKPRTVQATDSQSGSLLGPSFSAHEIQRYLDSANATYQKFGDEQELADRVACEISQGRVIGWFQGRMEYGPRALGSRSIIGDPRNPEMQTVMNVKVKFREGFRPFAPAVLREEASNYFDLPQGIDTPYMLIVAPVQDAIRKPLAPGQDNYSGITKLKAIRSEIPAVTHVDYSARVQTVDAERHGLYHKVIESFYRLTGCPVIVNTSFNLGWDPIVCTPADAYTTFMASDIDVLCMGPFLIQKRAQRAWVEDHAAFVTDGLTCPCGSGSTLKAHGVELRGVACGHRFPVEDGIPQLFWPGDKAPANKESAASDYDEDESVRSLIEKSRRRPFARKLDQAIPYNASVLEAGCGEGQLSNFLGISCRRVTGADPSLDSLRVAENFRCKHQLHRVRFVHLNLSHPGFRNGQFDVIVCNGIPQESVLKLAPSLRPGGYMVIRLPGGLRSNEVLPWFDQAGLDFVRSTETDGADKTGTAWFSPAQPGSGWDRFAGKVRRAVAGSGEDLLIARRREV
jgi:carbamoyltransferase